MAQGWGVAAILALLFAASTASVLASALSSTSESSPVRMEVFYESMCASCKEFIAKELLPLWSMLGNMDPPVLEVNLVPFGNADLKSDGSIECQHGPKECLANAIADCLLERAANEPDDFELALRTIICMGRARNSTPVETQAKHCISVPFDYMDIIECAQGPEGAGLQRGSADLTMSLDPPLDSVPWILVDGKHLDDSDVVEERYRSLICNRLNGTKTVPELCHDNYGNARRH